MKSNISDIASQPLNHVRNSTDYSKSDEYEFKSAIKQEQRDKILRFVLDNKLPDCPISYLGLPGKRWIFERMLDEECGDRGIITGIEKDVKTFHKSKIFMPGKDIYDKSKAVSQSKIEAQITNRAHYYCGDLVSLTDGEILHTIGDSDDAEEKSGTLVRGLTDNTIIWYDFTSPFNKDTYLAIYNIKNVAALGAVVCLTLMYGRDMYFNGSGEASRVEIVQRALPGFKLLDSWIYKGFKNTPMINICGIVDSE